MHTHRVFCRGLAIVMVGMILLVGCLWLLNTAQAANRDSPSPLFSSGALEKYILVEDFKDGDWQNYCGGNEYCWAANGDSISCSVQTVGNDGFLEMQYDVTTPTAYAVFTSELTKCGSLAALDAVWVAVKGENGSEPISIDFKDCGLPNESHDPKELISDYLAQDIITSEWSAVAIPLAAFSDEITDWTCVERLNIMAHNDIASGQGTIYVDEIRLLPAQVLVDDFHDTEPENELGGASDTWAYSGTIIHAYPGGVLELDYDVTTPTAAATYWTKLRYTNLLSQKDALFFKIRGDQGSEEIAVEFKDCGLSGWTHYPKVKVSDYLDGGITTDWRGVAIPLAAFADDMDWTCVDQMSFLVSANSPFNSGRGKVYVDDVILAPTSCSIPLMVDHFDDCNNDNGKWNALIGTWISGTDGTATIDFGPDPVHHYGNHGCGYRIIYTVSSSAAWLYSEMKGLDVTDYTHLRFFLKGAVGGEVVHVWLRDRKWNYRWQSIVASDHWQEVMIPLNYFSPAVDLRDLLELKIAFEYSPMAGEVYLDDISFIQPCAHLPIVLKDYHGEPCPDSMPSCPSPYNNYEPNNFRCSTTFTLNSGTPIQSYICASDDIDDYYYIDVTSPSPITVRLITIPSGVDYDLYLYYGDSRVAGSNNHGNANEGIYYTPSQTGRYYIRVYPYSGYSLSPYTLQANFQ